MALEKKDFVQIEKIVEQSEQRVVKKIEDEVGNLAAMAKRQFDVVDEKLDNLGKGQAKIRRDILHLNFVSSETVSKPEFFQIKERVQKIEFKLKMGG